RKPAPFDLAPKDINSGNYMCLTRLFGASDVEPPPPLFIEVGYAWASSPDESADGDKAEDTRADTIAIPAGYQPVICSAQAYALLFAGSAASFGVWVIVAGKLVISEAGQPYAESTIELDPSYAWPNGVPVSFAMHGHFDKTATVQIRLRCRRTTAAWQSWQLRTWERLRAAHQRLASDLDAEELLIPTPLIPAQDDSTPRGSELRALERSELRRWCTQSIRGRTFSFDTVATVGQHQEIEFSKASAQAPITNFFETAFDWDEMSFFLFPYYWARRSTWRLRRAISHGDSQHQDFLRSGAARCIVPVKPGYEEPLAALLTMDGSDEAMSIDVATAEANSTDGPFEELWLELLEHRKAEVSRGSGTLRVRSGSPEVQVSPDSSWTPSLHDLDRELFIQGKRYTISSLVDTTRFQLDRSFEGVDGDAERYATGAVPYSAPWLVQVPTQLVVLDEHRDDLEA
ncbi:MAG: hypothetical protein QNK05_24390, partial [Myxococcota bacterium]|nr:hypothetical protein [Myxococcota bacterium]